MKKLAILLLNILFVTNFYYAQTITENYIQTRNYLEPVTTTNNTTAKQTEIIQYFDGLGRAKQIVGVKLSPAGKDVVTNIEYNQYGLQTKEYLPVPQAGTQNGDIYSSPLGNANSVYGSEKIYSENVLEVSPLNRIQQKIQVGNDWSTKPINYKYDTNLSVDYVKKYETSLVWDPANKIFTSSIQLLQYYQPAQLFKTSVKDEDGNETITFKNKFNQVVLVRKVLSTTETADTYYAYNIYDQLAYVIPPLASVYSTLSSTILNDFCYQYYYDIKNRLAEKKIPGKGWEYMVYDRQDRLVAVQDANLKEKGQWMYTKYDQFGRAAITGLSTGSTRVAEQTIVDGLAGNNIARTNSVVFNRQGMDVYYDNSDSTYPSSAKWAALLSVNYFDTYPAYGFSPSFPSSIINQPTLTDNSTGNNISTKGLPVMSLTKNIEDDNWTKNYTWYDSKGRIIGTQSINHLGGYTKTESELDFVGITKQATTYHKRLNTDFEKVIYQTYEYDNQNRLKKHWHQVLGAPQELLRDNTYNELSQLVNKKVGGVISSPLQSVDYQYNVRGWMTKINDPQNLNGRLFGYEIKYQNPVNNLSTSKYNGNISEIDWKTSNGSILKRYDYQYDNLDRMRDAVYAEPLASVPGVNNYGESATYDLNGNIKTLKRFSGIGGAPMLIDDLDYSVYKGNQLIKVTDVSNNNIGYPSTSGNSMDYDVNGNMLNHIDKGITAINYNYLNLPSTVDLNQNSSFLKFLYRADGVKLQKSYSYRNPRSGVFITTTTDYLDGFQYISSALQFIPTAEGYYDFQYNTYVYQYKDQVGNVRLAYSKGITGAAVIDKETNYYPFGMEYWGSNGTYPLNRNYTYGFQEQERQEETGWNSFKWRNYDASLGRFFNVDPLSERYTFQSHYNFSENRVVNSRELEGLEAQDNYVDDDDYENQGNWVGVDFGAFDGKNISRSEFDWVSLMKNGIEGGVPLINLSWKVQDYSSREDMGKENNLGWLGIDDKDKFHDSLSNYEKWTKETGGDRIEREAYIFFGGFFAAPFVLAQVATLTGATSAGAYLESVAIRGAVDLTVQNAINGKVNLTQTLINSVIGGGGSSLNKILTATTNVSLNVTNNSFNSQYTSLANGGSRGAASLLFMTAASLGGSNTTAGKVVYEGLIQSLATTGDNAVSNEVK